MPSPLVQTKIGIPPLRSRLVARPRLAERLAQVTAYRLSLVCAPAGYGKTTTISAWLVGSGIPFAWLSLDEGDNDPVRFCEYLLTALNTLAPGIRPDLLAGMQAARLDTLASLLIDRLAENAAPFVLALDDFHVIRALPILEMLTTLVDHAPPALHLVLLSRTDPPLPLARLRARNQLLDIRADHLRFTADECALFLNQVMGLQLARDDIAAMEARTEGWIAGLQLAALSMQGRGDLHGFVSAFAGSHRYIMDYLIDEALARQPEGIRTFLLETSILDHLCGPLCDAVVERDGPESNDGQAMLEALERQNLFLVPLDTERRWYRYHALFADMLNQQLAHRFPERVADLHRRASLWHEQNGLMPEAIRHALAAGEWERARRLVDDNGCALLMSGELVTLLEWIAAVESHAPITPWLAIQKAWALLVTGRSEHVEPALAAAEQQIAQLAPSGETKTMRGALVAARAQQANVQRHTSLAADLARRALQDLNESDPLSCSLSSAVTSILGDASRMNGDVEQARQAYTRAVAIGKAAHDLEMVILANTALAQILAEQGSLRRAASVYAHALQSANRSDRRVSPWALEIYAGLGRVSYEWNDLEAAALDAQQCITLAKRCASVDYQAAGHLLLARVELARGNAAASDSALRVAEQLASECDLAPLMAAWFQSTMARMWIDRGNPARAARLVRESGITTDDEIPYLREQEYLVFARLLLADGDHEAALALSKRVRQQAEAAKRVGRAIEALALEALALHANQDLAQALKALASAVELAEPERYIRVFLDEGEPMAALLHQLKARRMGSGFAAELLAARGGDAGTTQPAAQSLIEPLSAREVQVFRLIQDGCSNQEIATQLVISVKTVKRHISNIYAKLGVTTRTRAIAVGRELGL